MLDHEDLKWTAANVTELNRRLQQIARYTDSAQKEHKGVGESLALLGEEVEQASRTSQALFDRITSRLLAGVANGGRAAKPGPVLQVMPAPDRTRMETKIPVGEMALNAGGFPPMRNPQGARELILVVDDEPEILEHAGSILEDNDYRIVLAKDGFEALQIYQQMGNEISLIILDFFLPVMNGDAVFDELKALDPKVQIVLSSGFAEQTKLGSMLARGLCGFIPKPYTGEKLLDQVRSIIAA